MFFFFNDTATTEIYTLSLHDALPIWAWRWPSAPRAGPSTSPAAPPTRPSPIPCSAAASSRPRSEEHTSELQSRQISYAVFCLKKKKNFNFHPFYLFHRSLLLYHLLLP